MSGTVASPVMFSRPRYRMLGSRMVIKRPSMVQHCIRSLRERSSCVTSKTASKSTACSALFLFTFFTVSVSTRILYSTSCPGHPCLLKFDKNTRNICIFVCYLLIIRAICYSRVAHRRKPKNGIVPVLNQISIQTH